MLEPHSLIFVLLGIQFAMYAIAWWAYSELAHEDKVAGRHWGLFNVLVGAGMLLTWTRDDSRGWAAYVGSSLCFVSAFMAGWRGITSFMRIEQLSRVQLSIMGLTVVVLLYAGPGVERASLRVFTTFFASAVIITWAARQVGPLLRQEFHWKWSRVVRIGSAGAIVLLGWRAIQQLLHPEQRLELNNAGPNAGLLIGLLIAASIFNFSYFGLQLLRYIRRLYQLTHHDPLTGLLNRRAFEEATQREWLRRKREPTPLAVAAFDLDHFKSVNDEHGHAVGDLVLIHTAQLLRRMSREVDLVARLGGEEFVVVMPGTTEEEALAAAERLRNALAVEPVTLSGGKLLRVTSSIGLAMAEPEDADVHATLKRADEALYKAKHSGRNRVCRAPFSSSSMPSFQPSVI